MNTTNLCSLDQALIEAFQSEEKRAEFYNVLQNSDLYVIASIEGDTKTDEEGQLLSTEHTQLQLHYFEMEDGLLLPLYSDLKHLELVIPNECPYVCMNAVELLKLVDVEANIMLNPGTMFQKVLVKEEIEAICDGTIVHVFSKDK